MSVSDTIDRAFVNDGQLRKRIFEAISMPLIPRRTIAPSNKKSSRCNSAVWPSLRRHRTPSPPVADLKWCWPGRTGLQTTEARQWFLADQCCAKGPASRSSAGSKRHFLLLTPEEEATLGDRTIWNIHQRPIYELCDIRPKSHDQ